MLGQETESGSHLLGVEGGRGGQWVESPIQPGPQPISNLGKQNDFLLFSILQRPSLLSRDHKTGQMTLGVVFPRETLTSPVEVALPWGPKTQSP